MSNMLGRACRTLAVLASVTVAGAQVTPVPKCTPPKLRAAGRGVAARLACLAKAAGSGRPVDPRCNTDAYATLTRAFGRADQHGRCPVAAGPATALVDACVDQVATLLPDSGACTATKLRAAGKQAAGKLRCDSRAGTTGVARPSCLTERETMFADAFAHAEKSGPCTGTAAAVEAAVDACRAEVLATLLPTPTTTSTPSTTTSTTSTSTTTSTASATTSTTLGSVCGDGIVEAGEQCDGQSFCDSSCFIVAGYCCDAMTMSGPMCAELGLLDSGCYFGCMQFGGQCSFGSCVGTGCTSVPVTPTSICCQNVAGCSAAVVSGTGDVAHFVHDCGYGGGLDMFVGTCAPDGHCVRGG